MAADITLYNQDYGQRLQLNTWCDEIDDATALAVRFRRLSTGQTLELSATAVPAADLDNPDKKAIVCTIPANWLKNKLGRWVLQPRIKWSDAWISSKHTVTLDVRRHPTVTTTTTSTTTSTTSTTTTA